MFERCVLCGFGVAADVRKLFASYPDRFEKRFSGISVRTVCVRDIAVGLGVDEVKVRGLASMCALCLGGRELDKSKQKSDWGARPLSDAQISYAALDALAPAMILRRLLASRSTAVGSNPIGGDTCGVYLNVGKTLRDVGTDGDVGKNRFGPDRGNRTQRPAGTKIESADDG